MVASVPTCLLPPMDLSGSGDLPTVIKKNTLSPKSTPQPEACPDDSTLGRKGQGSWATSVPRLGHPLTLDEAGKAMSDSLPAPPPPPVFHRAWQWGGGGAGGEGSSDLRSPEVEATRKLCEEEHRQRPPTPSTQIRALDG